MTSSSWMPTIIVAALALGPATSGCVDFREGLRCLHDADCRGLSCVNGICGDPLDSSDVFESGDVTVVWDFDFKTCAGDARIARVRLDLDGSPSSSTGLACRNDDEDGADLGQMSGGAHSYSGCAETADGRPLYCADGGFTVAGDVDVYIHFKLVGEAQLAFANGGFGDGTVHSFYRGVATPLMVQLANSGAAESGVLTGLVTTDFAGVKVNPATVTFASIPAAGSQCAMADTAAASGSSCGTSTHWPVVTADSTVPDNANVEFTVQVTDPASKQSTFKFNAMMLGNPP